METVRFIIMSLLFLESCRSPSDLTMVGTGTTACRSVGTLWPRGLCREKRSEAVVYLPAQPAPVAYRVSAPLSPPAAGFW